MVGKEEIGTPEDEISFITPWGKLMLTEFPYFNPAWSDDVKLTWVKTFDEILRYIALEMKGEQ